MRRGPWNPCRGPHLLSRTTPGWPGATHGGGVKRRSASEPRTYVDPELVTSAGIAILIRVVNRRMGMRTANGSLTVLRNIALGTHVVSIPATVEDDVDAIDDFPPAV